MIEQRCDTSIRNIKNVGKERNKKKPFLVWLRSSEKFKCYPLNLHIEKREKRKIIPKQLFLFNYFLTFKPSQPKLDSILRSTILIIPRISTDEFFVS